MAKAKNKPKSKRGVLSALMGIMFLVCGAVMMVNAFDIAYFIHTETGYVFTASIALIIWGVFDLTILPLLSKKDKY